MLFAQRSRIIRHMLSNTYCRAAHMRPPKNNYYYRLEINTENKVNERQEKEEAKYSFAFAIDSSNNVLDTSSNRVT